MDGRKQKYFKKVNGRWIHRTPLKIIVNYPLRILQFFTNRPIVLASKCVYKGKDIDFLGYSFIRVKFIPSKDSTFYNKIMYYLYEITGNND